MVDREKVIETLEKAKMVIESWVPMFEQYNTPAGIDVAIALLREQEPVEPHWRCSTVYMNGTGKIDLMCGNCGISIPLGKPNYCPWCGRKVKWDG